MSISIKGILLGAVAAMLLAIGPGQQAVADDQIAAAHAGAGGPHAAMIQKRIGLMRGMSRAMRGGDAAGVATAAKALQDKSLWPAGSANPKNRAKAAIWQNMDDFIGKFAPVSTAAAAVVAGSADIKSIGKNCGACHKLYRGPRPGGKGKGKGKRG